MPKSTSRGTTSFAAVVIIFFIKYRACSASPCGASIQPVSVNDAFGAAAMDAVRGIREKIPGAHTTCGLSNISFGLLERKLLNGAFAVALMCSGMDTLIIDPLDRRIMAMIAAARAVTGQDEFCDDYLKAFRKGTLKVA